MQTTSERDIFGKVLGVLFILSSLPKLLSVAVAVQNFHVWHLGDGWRYVVGSIELLCGIVMFVPALKRFGAFGFFSLMPAAFLVHITVGQYSQAPVPIVLGLAVLAYLHQQRVVRLLDAPEPPAPK